MADSVFELVAKNVLVSLQNITTANGYEIAPLVRRGGTDKDPDVKGVAQDPFTDAQTYTVDIEIQQLKYRQDMPQTYGKRTWHMPFMLICTIMQSQKSAVQTDAICNQIVASVVKALMTDAQRGLYPATSNPLAIDTTLDGDIDMLVKVDGSCEGLLIPFSVQVRHAENDPYSQ